MERRLYKTKDGAMIAGVCAGIAEYFSIDVTLIRIGFVLIALAGGSGVLAYLLAAIIMPEKSQVAGSDSWRRDTGTQSAPAQDNTSEQDHSSTDEPTSDWRPMEQSTEQSNQPRPTQDNQRLLAYILIGIGAWIIMDRYVNLHGMFRHWWPLLLVGVGVLMLTGGWNRRA